MEEPENESESISAEEIYLARQPIVDVDKELLGFELLFRSAADPDRPATPGNLYATTRVIANAFAEIGLDQVIGDVDGYINVDGEFLFSDFLETLPPEKIVLELLETTIGDERIVTRVRELRDLGYRIAIDNFVGNFDDFDTLLRYVDLVKIDFQAIDTLLIPTIVKMLGRHDVPLLAAKIETPAEFAQARDLGIQMFQGYHFAKPEEIRGHRSRPARFALLRLLALASKDADTREIENELKHHPTLSVNLLRLANSAAMGSRHVITSLRHALVLIGRRQLQLWLQLLLYTADSKSDSLNSPLLQMAAARGKLLEQLAAKSPEASGGLQEMAFMTGMLSLMDVLLGMPLPEVLAEISVPHPVVEALVKREGRLGELLQLAEQLETDNHQAVRELLRRSRAIVTPSELLPMQMAAYRWANEVVSAAAN